MDEAIIVGLCVGAVAVIEVAAHVMDLWQFRSVAHRAAVAVAAGTAFGILSVALAAEPIATRFAVGAAAGVAYEAANLFVLHWWTFPDNRLLFLRGRTSIILAAGIPWGLLPAVTSLL